LDSRKRIGIFLVVVLLIGAITVKNIDRLPFINSTNDNAKVEKPYGVSFLVIHEENKGMPLYQHLSQSTVVGLEVEEQSSIDALNTDLGKYDVIYIHQSLNDKGKLKSIQKQIETYVANGGKLFLDIDLINEFSKKLTGVVSGEKIDANVIPFTYPEVSKDFEGIQRVATAFEKDYKEYIKEELLIQTSNPSTAKTVVGYDGGSILTINDYKDGQVFVISDFLPNYSKYITSFDLNYRNEENNYFQFFYATGNTQMLNELAAYVAKDVHGLALKKVMGTYGRPVVAWQNHYEVLSSIKNKELIEWIDILREYGNIFILVLIIVVMLIINPRFLSINNIINISRQMVPVGLLAMGAMFVIMSGGLDLSAAFGVSLAAAIFGFFYEKTFNIFIIILLTIIAGIVMGIFNGLIITRLKMLPFIVTLATMAIFQGLTYSLAGAKLIYIENSFITFLGSATIMSGEKQAIALASAIVSAHTIVIKSSSSALFIVLSKAERVNGFSQ